MFGLLFPILALFILEKGMDLLQLGTLMAVYSASIIITELPTGGLSDTIGRKKIYLTSLIINFLSGLLIIFAESFILLIPGFALLGIARALSSGSLDAHFVDELYKLDSKVDLQRIMAILNTIVPISVAVASLIGGYIPLLTINLIKPYKILNLYSSNFIIYLLILIIQFILTIIFVKEQTNSHPENAILKGFKDFPQMLSTSITYGLKNRVILILLLGGLTLGFSLSGLEQFWQPRVQEITENTDKTWIYGFLGFGYFFAAAIGSSLSIPICRLFKKQYKLVLFLMRFIMGISFLILAFRGHLLGFSIFYLMTFASSSVSASSESAVFNSAVPSERRSTLMSFSSLFLHLGGLTGSVVMGFISRNYSITISWLVAASILLISSVLYLRLPLNSEKENSIDTQGSEEYELRKDWQKGESPG